MASKYLRALTVSGLLANAGTLLFAQPQFEVPLRVSDGFVSDTIYFGILPTANFCIVPTDCFNYHCEQFLPPPPPQGVFDARFICPRTGCVPICFDQGSSNDFRPFISASQRDTFLFRSQPGTGTSITVCWPPGLSAYFTELTICGINALTDTCAVSSGGCRIISGGLVVTAIEENHREGVLNYPTLSQNYPNPFNPSTVISFSLPAPSFVRLRVYDVLGREIATLLEGEQEAGVHRVQWRPEGVSGGIYTYRLTTPGGMTAKKMLLLR